MKIKAFILSLVLLLSACLSVGCTPNGGNESCKLTVVDESYAIVSRVEESYEAGETVTVSLAKPIDKTLSVFLNDSKVTPEVVESDPTGRSYVLSFVMPSVDSVLAVYCKADGEIPAKTKIKIWGFGTMEEEKEYRAVVNEFNLSKYAQQKGVTLKLTWYAGTLYNLTINNGSSAVEDKVDIIFVPGNKLKKWADEEYISPIWSHLTGEELLDVTESFIGREEILNAGRFNKKGYTSYSDDRLYAVPVEVNPKVLYYNKTALENAGVIVIFVENQTVTQENFNELSAEYEGLKTDHIGQNLMDLWNDGVIKDKFGNSLYSAGERAGYTAAKLSGVTVPKKGYFRADSLNNFVVGEEFSPEYEWVNPNEKGVTNTVKVFNAGIAMNWDERDDIARLMTEKYNSVTHGKYYENNLTVATKYGYHMDCDFSSLYTVGGSALCDYTGEGTWAEALSSFTPNYVVVANQYVGVNTGRVYKRGEALSILDVLDCEGITPIRDRNGNIILEDGAPVFDYGMLLPMGNGYGVYDLDGNLIKRLEHEPETTISDALVSDKIKKDATRDLSLNESAKLLELPSNLYAAGRDRGLVMAEHSTAMPSYANEGVDSAFALHGYIAFAERYAGFTASAEEYAPSLGMEWGIAPLPVYKQYLYPRSNDDTVVREGLASSSADIMMLAVASGCKDKELAADIIRWMVATEVTTAGEKESAGQALLSKNGGYPVLQSAERFAEPISAEEKAGLSVINEAKNGCRAPAEALLPDTTWVYPRLIGLGSGQNTLDQISLKYWAQTIRRISNVEILAYSYMLDSAAYKTAWYRHFGQAE